MTLEEASAAALAASMSGDLEGLERALGARGVAIQELLQERPSEQVAMRLKNAIGAGEFVRRDLRALRGRITVLQAALRTGDATPGVVDVRG